MVEGESGILATSRDRARPIYEPSKRRLTWPNGAIATTYSADEPERLRGPQHSLSWCDEVGCLIAGTLILTPQGERPILASGKGNGGVGRKRTIAPSERGEQRRAEIGHVSQG